MENACKPAVQEGGITELSWEIFTGKLLLIHPECNLLCSQLTPCLSPPLANALSSFVQV